MERTVATAIIAGKTYKLVPKTIAINNRIEELVKLGKKVENGHLAIEEMLKKQVAFIGDVADCHIYDGIPVQELDIDDVLIACVSIVNGYKNKVTKAHVSEIAGAFNIPNQNYGNTKKKKKK